MTKGAETAIETIDLDRFVDGTNRDGVARQVARSCEEIGFIIVSGDVLAQ